MERREQRGSLSIPALNSTARVGLMGWLCLNRAWLSTCLIGVMSVAVESAENIVVACEEGRSGAKQIDDPSDWQPDAEWYKHALPVLDEKLKSWGSHSDRDVARILGNLGDDPDEAAREYLVGFLRVSPELKGSWYLASPAALALGELGGPGAFEELNGVVARGWIDVLPSVALALGLLGEPRAIAVLEGLAVHPDLETRQHALPALSNYCSPTSRHVVESYLTAADSDSRDGATWWLATCGVKEDERLLADRLLDKEALVRAHALKGLTRLESRLGCQLLRVLLADHDATVRDAAKQYASVCETASP